MRDGLGGGFGSAYRETATLAGVVHVAHRYGLKHPDPGPPLRGEGEGVEKWMAVNPGRSARFGCPLGRAGELRAFSPGYRMSRLQRGAAPRTPGTRYGAAGDDAG